MNKFQYLIKIIDMNKLLHKRASALPTLLLLMLLALIPAKLSAQDFSYTYEGKTLNYTVIDEEAKTVQTKEGYVDAWGVEIIRHYGNYASGSLVIPSEVEYNNEKYTVVAIGYLSFYGNYGLTSATIPNSVTSIGLEAFLGCVGLTNATIPNSVTSIDRSVFSGCSGLTSITIPNSVTSIAMETFYGCSGLTNVTIPNSVTSIAVEAFSGCSSLTSITIPNSMTSIARFAFSGCNNLTNIKLEGDVPPEFDAYSFANYDAEVTVPEGTIPVYLATDWVKFSTIKDTAGLVSSAFTDDVFNFRLMSDTEAMVVSGNYRSMTTVSIPERVVFEDSFVYVTAIGNAFTDCTNITSLVLPKRLTKIVNNAFSGCTGLTSLDLPETLTTIGENAFRGCTGLGEVTFPTNITTIGDYAFYGCTGLTGPANQRNYINFSDKLGTVGNYAFYNCRSLKAVYFKCPELSIGEHAFENCDAMTTVSIWSDVANNKVKIGAYAFKGCNSLDFAPLDHDTNTKTIIGERAFEGCNKLEGVTLGNPESVGKYAFAGCSLLGKVKVNWPVVKEGTFDGCSFLHDLEISDDVTTIGENAFTGMKDWDEYNIPVLNNIHIPASVTSIGKNAFVFNTNTPVTVILEDGSAELSLGNSFVAPEINLYIGRNVEANSALCSTANEVTFGNGVTSISDNLFNGVSGLKTVNFGSSIETIGANAFNGCGLTELVLPPHVKTLGDNAFAGNNIKNIAIGSEITEIGEKAFDGANELTGVSITAITPPAANNNSFSYYDCPLYVTPGCVDTYYNFTRCWYRFSGHELIPIDKLTVEGNSTVNLKPGETYKLSVGITPANASLPYIFWRSTNPEFATVDSEGNVTRVDQGTESAQADGDVTNECKIIAETLYADVPVAEFTIQDSYAGIDEIVVESTAAPKRPNDIYNMQGVCLKRNASQADIDALTTGLYIIGGKKVLVK